MFARLTIAQFKPGTLGKLISTYRDSIVPAAESQKGYVKAYLLTNSKENKGIAITVWESEDDAVAGEQSGYYQEQIGKVKYLFASVPIREGYEVAVK